MGEVYRARDGRLSREVAIKVLPPALAADQDRLRRFQQEAEAAGLLNHPNIMAVYDVGSQAGMPYVVCELLEGETLRRRLADGPLPWRKAAELAAQTARALAAAHERGIVHRDLKPENLFITTDGRLKVLDFGLAKLTQPDGDPLASPDPYESPTLPGAIVGTAGYMAPEQARGRAADARSDLFSLGAVLYEMIAGRAPFRGESSVDTLTALLRENPPDLSLTRPDLPPALGRVVRRCLEKRPGERFQNARDLAFHLEATLGEKAGDSGTGVSRRATWLVSVLPVLTLLAGLAAGWWLAQPDPRGSLPSFRRLAFRRGVVTGARFAPGSRSIVYSAGWDGGPSEVYVTGPDGPESRSLGLGPAHLLAVSRGGELALLLRPRHLRGFVSVGTLARAPIGGGAPREVLERVQEADFAPDGASLAIVRDVGGQSRLEFPPGSVLYETGGYVSHIRVSPQGDQVAFVDHAIRSDDGGSIAVVDRSRNVRQLSSGWLTLAGLGWSPSGREVWFTGAKVGMRRALQAVTLDGRERLLFEALGALTLHDLADGQAIVVREDLRREVMGLAPGETQERNLSWLDWSRATDLSSDGRRLVFTEQGEGAGTRPSVYMRTMDGGPAVRLGEGISTSLSPDGRFVLVLKPGSPTQLRLLPIGPGEPRDLTRDEINHHWATWHPDGKSIIFSGNPPGRAVRLYWQQLDGSRPQALTPEGIRIIWHPVSPDGKWVAGVGPGEEAYLYPVAGGERQPVAGWSEGDRPVRFSADGEWLLVFREGEVPADVFRIHLASGRREHYRTFMPPDPTGVTLINPSLLSADGRAHAYSYRRVLSDLFLAQGLP